MTIELKHDVTTIVAAGKASNVDLVLEPKGSGVVSVSGHLVRDALDPVSASDLATKAYVDQAIAEIKELLEKFNLRLNLF